MADIVLLVHILWILFVVANVPIIILGYFLSWRFIENNFYRTLHLCLVALVFLETIFGIACPLTTLERMLRGSFKSESGFVATILHRWFFFNFPTYVFAIAYGLFLMLVVTCYLVVPPTWLKNRRHVRGK